MNRKICDECGSDRPRFTLAVDGEPPRRFCRRCRDRLFFVGLDLCADAAERFAEALGSLPIGSVTTLGTVTSHWVMGNPVS